MRQMGSERSDTVVVFNADRDFGLAVALKRHDRFFSLFSGKTVPNGATFIGELIKRHHP